MLSHVRPGVVFTLCTKLFPCHVPPDRCNTRLGQNIFLLAVRVRQIINTEDGSAVCKWRKGRGAVFKRARTEVLLEVLLDSELHILESQLEN